MPARFFLSIQLSNSRVILVCRRFGQAQGGRTIKHTITARLREKRNQKPVMPMLLDTA